MLNVDLHAHQEISRIPRITVTVLGCLSQSLRHAMEQPSGVI